MAEGNSGRGIMFATLEGGIRAVTANVGKVLGSVAQNAAWCTLLAITYGACQAVQGMVTLQREGESLRPVNSRAFWLYLLFSVGAVVNTTLGVYVYVLPGADIAVSTFLRTFSIVIAAPFAWHFFSERLKMHQIFGVLVFLFAGWFFVGTPSLGNLSHLPVWMWLSLVIAVFAAINEIATSALNKLGERNSPANEAPTQKAAREKLDRARFNFWIGSLTVTLAIPVFAVLYTHVTVPLSLLAVGGLLAMSGLIVVQLNWRYIAYQGDGNFVVIKKFFTQSTYFILAALLGVLFHREPLTWQKLTGIPFAILAFLLLDKRAFGFIWHCLTASRKHAQA